MRSLELARVAAAAESLRLRRMARRQAIRAGLAAGAFLFGLATVLMIHVVAWHALRERMTDLQASLVLLAVDVTLAVILGAFAARDVPGKLEVEAQQIRTRALEEARTSVSVLATLTEVVALTTRRVSGTGKFAMALDLAARLLRR